MAKTKKNYALSLPFTFSSVFASYFFALQKNWSPRLAITGPVMVLHKK